LRSVQVCELSGLLPTPSCAHTRAEWFIAGTEPTTQDTWHTGTQLNLPVPLREWAREQGWRLASDELGVMSDDSSLITPNSSFITLVQPDDGSLFRISKALPRSVQRIPLSVAVNEREVSRVDLLLNTGEVIATFTQAPFTAVWPMTPGTFILTAKATLRDGQVITSPPIRITVLD
jgi:hypothetical protein